MNKFYLKEFQLYDEKKYRQVFPFFLNYSPQTIKGHSDTSFNTPNGTKVAVAGDKITVSASKCSKISVLEYDLYTDENGLYFEYEIAGQEHIYINDFEEIK